MTMPPPQQFKARTHANDGHYSIEVTDAPDAVLVGRALLERIAAHPADPLLVSGASTVTTDEHGTVITTGTPGLGLGVVTYRVGPYRPDLGAHEATRIYDGSDT